MDSQSLLMFFSRCQPRRIKVIENLLRGRKTVSILYWGLRYHLLGYLGALKLVNSSLDLRSLRYLLARRDLVQDTNNRYLLSARGDRKKPVPILSDAYLKLNLFYQVSRFRDRFLLAVQVASEYSYHNQRYYPLQINFRDANLVKAWFYRYRQRGLVRKLTVLIRDFATELSERSPTLAWQAVSLLVGHATPGKTLSQLSVQLNVPVIRLWFRQLKLWCKLLFKFLRSHDPFFSMLLLGLKSDPISRSARVTLQMALHHVPLRRISRSRSLKLSTVKEHLLTAAIFGSNHFPYSLFIPQPFYGVLCRLYSGNPDHWDYDRYRKVTGQSLDFFYFRMYQIMGSKIHG